MSNGMCRKKAKRRSITTISKSHMKSKNALNEVLGGGGGVICFIRITFTKYPVRYDAEK